MEQSPKQPPTNDELLEQAEKNLTWADNNYGGKNDLATTAALLSLARSALVIARSIAAQTDMMSEVHLADLPVQGSDDLTGAGGDAL